MDGHDSSRPQFSPHEVTLDAPSSPDGSPAGGAPAGSLLNSGSSARGPLSPSAPSPHPLVKLVEGSGSGVSGETRCLLQSRLRAAALVMFIGFLVFLLWFAFTAEFEKQYVTPLFYAHVIVTAILAAASGLMMRRCGMSMTQLRIKEAVIFGLPAIYFCFMQHVQSMHALDDIGFIPQPAAPWLILMYTYAIFIPNTWRRAAVVIGAMALAPIVMLVVLWRSHAGCSMFLAEHTPFGVQTALTLLVSALGAIMGVYTIGRLRKEAYEARQLGQYKLKRLLGAGGMGEVYLAEHQLMKRPCAVKVIRPEKAGDPRVLARFEREVKATSKLSHWNSIYIYDYGRTEDGTFYYAMEYLPGMNLHELVQRSGPLQPARVIHLMRQVCDALEEAHQMGLVHRDIKPANIFAAQRGGRFDVAKLLDFGLAKPLTGADDERSLQLTQEGSITGSPLFLSPEQATGESEPDARSDIYSLGVVMYYLLTGQPPFDGDKAIRVIISHAQDKPTPPSEINPLVPADLEAIVLRCLEKKPEDRYQSAEDLAAALDACQQADAWDYDTAEAWWRSSPIEPATEDPAEEMLV